MQDRPQPGSCGVWHQYAHKKTKNLRLTDIARGLDTQDWELVRDVLATLNNYMASADAELGRPHFRASATRRSSPVPRNASSSRAWTWRE